MQLGNLDIIAAGRFAADGTTNGAGFFARGCSVNRAGAGLYDITIDNGPLVGEADSSECVVLPVVEATARQPRVTHTSDSVKRITVEDNAGAAADSISSFLIVRTKTPLGG